MLSLKIHIFNHIIFGFFHQKCLDKLAITCKYFCHIFWNLTYTRPNILTSSIMHNHSVLSKKFPNILILRSTWCRFYTFVVLLTMILVLLVILMLIMMMLMLMMVLFLLLVLLSLLILVLIDC